jgi:predicted metalloprotease
MGMPMKMGGGLGGLLILVLIVFLGGDPGALLNVVGGGEPATTGQPRPVAADDESAQFISAILASTEDVWGQLFQQGGATYQQPTLVLFEDAVRSACGFNSAATGPFYCPGDQKVYLDLDFFRELARLGGPGDFAAAYVVGHEIGHHVQQLAGISDQVRRLQGGARQQADVNALQVLMELQADCFAGVWAYHANQQRSLLETGDVEEGLGAAAAIGDDRLLRRAGQRVAPESFTHGSSEQRQQCRRPASGPARSTPATRSAGSYFDRARPFPESLTFMSSSGYGSKKVCPSR